MLIFTFSLAKQKAVVAYADDTQVYMRAQSQSVEQISDWTSQSSLQLNKDKTEIMMDGEESALSFSC